MTIRTIRSVRPHAALASACVVAAIGWATPARADDESAATELFNAGRDLMKQGDYATACPKLAESVRLKPTVGALAKLAGCEEHENRLASARARWEQALNLAHSLGDDRERSVAGELARVDARVPKLTLTTAAALPPGAMIRVDGLALGTASLGVPLPVEPGDHEVRVTGPDKRPWSTVVATIANGALIAVAIPALEDAAPQPVPPPTPGPSEPVAPPAPAVVAEGVGMPLLRVVGLATAGAGVVALGVGTVFGAQAMSQRSDAHCAGTVCPDGASGTKLQDAKSSADASTAAFGIGGALVVGGAALWLLAPRSQPTRAAFEVHPSLGGVVVSGRW